VASKADREAICPADRPSEQRTGKLWPARADTAAIDPVGLHPCVPWKAPVWFGRHVAAEVYRGEAALGGKASGGARRCPRVAATTGRLPPGQTLTTGFPVLRPRGEARGVPLDQWRLTIDGLVEKPVTLDWAQFNALPQVEDVSDFHCVTSWSKYDCRWSGVAFAHPCELVEPIAGSALRLFHQFRRILHQRADGEMPRRRCAGGNAILTGSPSPANMVAPARVIIPKLYAWKGAKFVKGITFLDEDKLGFWEVRGYSNGADPWKEERYA